jgi:hypothetical protein
MGWEPGGGGGGGGVEELTSPGGTLTITKPFGPIVKADVTNGEYVPITAPLIDLTAAPYNAVPGADITAALQAAVNTATLTNGGVDIFFSKPGQYLLNGAQQTGTAFGYAYSGQILFPAFSDADQRWPVIRIRGELPTGFGPANLPETVLVSDATTGNIFDVIPGALVNAQPSSGLTVLLEDIAILGPTNPQCGGVKLQCAAFARTDRVFVATPAPNLNPSTLSGNGLGLTMPGMSSSGQTIRDTWVAGWPLGLQPGDHCVMVGDNEIYGCRYALNLNGGDNPQHLQGYSWGCTYGIVGSAVTMVTGEWGFESDGIGLVAVEDPNDYIYGDLTVFPDVYTTSSPLPSVFGPTPHLNMRRSQNGLDWMRSNPLDTFTRSAGAATSGAAVPGVCDQTLNPWYVTGGGFQIATAGQLKGTTGSNECITLAKNGGDQRTVTAAVTLGSASPNVYVLLQYVTANQIGISVGPSNTVTLNMPGGATYTGGTVAPSTSYVVAGMLFYNDAGLPWRVQVSLGGTVIIDHVLTSAEVTALTPGGSNSVAYDGIFVAETGTIITRFSVADRLGAPDPAPWITPAPTSPWVNTGSGWAPFGYRISTDGKYVELSGLVQSGTSGITIYTLPAGYRPINNQASPCYGEGTDGLQIYTSGVINPVSVKTYIGMSGVRFALDI